jgi:RimJ/RimL family protein N-acetyltransferase
MLAYPTVMGAGRKAPFPPERSQATFQHILKHWERHGYGPWATFEKASGRYVGHIGLEYMEDWPFEHKTEVGFVIASDPGTKASRPKPPGRVFNTTSHVAGLSRISTNFEDHRASRRVMEKCGMAFH